MDIVKHIKSHKYLGYILISISLILIIASLPNRILYVDDSWYAEQSYWFAKEGHVKSNLFSGVLDYENKQTTYHRMHIWQGAAAVKLFGWSIYNFKSISLIYLILLLASIAYYYRKNYGAASDGKLLLFFILFLSNSFVVQFGFVFRPELPMMFFGFWSFFYIKSYIENSQMQSLIIAGSFSGIAVLFHLNGLIYAASGAMLLLAYREYKSVIWFSLFVLIISLLYFLDIMLAGDLEKFIYQFGNDPALRNKDFNVLGIIGKFFSEPVRYFNHPREGTYSLFVLFVLWVSRKKIFENPSYRIVAIYLLSLMFFMAVLSPGKKPYYLLLTMPFILILVSTNFSYVLSSGNIKKIFLLFSLTLYLLVNFGQTYRKNITRNVDIAQVHEEVVQKFKIPKGVAIAAPIGFIFDQNEKFNIQSIHAYLLMSLKGGKGEKNIDIAKYAALSDRKYIIVREERKLLPEKEYSKYYDLLGEHKGYFVYKRMI